MVRFFAPLFSCTSPQSDFYFWYEFQGPCRLACTVHLISVSLQYKSVWQTLMIEILFNSFDIHVSLCTCCTCTNDSRLKLPNGADWDPQGDQKRKYDLEYQCPISRFLCLWILLWILIKPIILLMMHSTRCLYLHLDHSCNKYNNLTGYLQVSISIYV